MNNDFVKNNDLLWHYLEIASDGIQGSVNKGREINFKCNVCGDGSGRKKRGYLIWDYRRDLIYYKCFNEGDCPAAGEGNAYSGSRWLRSYYPTLYKNYLKDILVNGKNTTDLSKKTTNLKYKIADEAGLKQKEESEAVKHFRPINSIGEIFKLARDECKRRAIPKSLYNDFFVAVDGKYNKRLIIPFYDADGKIYYYQARALYDWQNPKYLNRTLGRDNAIYNLYFVHRDRPVTILEGPIDSMFIENGIATLGLSWTDEMKNNLAKFKELKFLLDNDCAGKSKSLKLLKAGCKVFNWNLFIKNNKLPDSIKDINDAYRYLKRSEKFSIEELQKYFTSDYYDQPYFI